MAQKRAPGAGRKAKGPNSGNSAVITVRVQPQTRDDLERAAKRNGFSLSQEIQLRLIDGGEASRFLYGQTDSAYRRNKEALGELVAEAAAWVERSTGRSWREDAYTHAAVSAAIVGLLDRLAPEGPVTVPAPDAGPMRLIYGKHSAHPEDPRESGDLVARSLTHQLHTTPEPPRPLPKGEAYAEGFYRYPRIRRYLGLQWEKGTEK